MKSSTRADLIIGILNMLFIILFVYAAGSKLLEYDKFRAQIGQSPLLTSFGGLIVWSIPAIEILIAIMLAIPRWQRLGLYAFFTLMVMFSAYIIAITRFSEYVPCSCGGVLEKLSWNQHLVVNIGFVCLAATAIFLNERHTSQKIIPSTSS